MKALVWLKRDLRLHDHAPLAEAARADGAAALWLLEPAWLHSAECDPQHVAFALACLAPLRDDLGARGLPLWVEAGDAVAVLQALHARHGFTHLFSHEETGPGWSYDRDRAVAAWCRAAGVVWRQWPQTGVVRLLRDRRGWAGRWLARMDAPQVTVPAGWRGLVPPQATPLPTLACLGLPPARPLPAAGEAPAQALLQDFTAGRARGYRRALSSPLTAAEGCSRLSPHLAFGTLSMRQVHQTTEAAIRATPDRALAHGLRGFAGRLRWHCHFMQKLEDEPAVEFRNFSRTCDGLRPGDDAGGGPPFGASDSERFDAWCEGRTGFPMVDACMRQLRATGWLNFRMRAMLVSFAAYHLWLHWRAPGLFLARQFLDFEPGIHWSQMQMQSGTTGINTLRIYSPTKQAQDHDPDGTYVRRWVPEFGTPAYPKPIVGERAALATAKERLYGLRRTAEARQEADAIQQRHGSRKSGLPRSGLQRRGTSAKVVKDVRQQELF
ncbi:MAG: deoxyribodipyrimidine photo-lyase [Burkholderiaceae bacterium]|nr:deoxyribodipyrimidine photo-lyase [Rhodoferax sp.]MCP5286812.1 deoxyribodipyrimidine photo-lyase [Burkholderiaceae bacterium]